MASQSLAKIIANQQLNSKDYRLLISAPQIAKEAQVGQFLHLQCKEGIDPLLRRPFSIHDYDRQQGEVAILYRVLGKGTKQLLERRPGQEIDVLGPLGNGFDLTNTADKVVLVAGGIGVAPLVPLAKELIELDKEVAFLLGAANELELLCMGELEQLPLQLKVATIDGSLGHQGYVTELLEELLADSYGQVFACGPEAMLAAVQEITLKAGVEAQLSLEKRMGCGTGACLSCVCKVKVQQGSGFEYQRVCSEGPVFRADEVIFDE
ncbi:dihydroorotate dehydrogenase electron transfer subunit [Fuchsiella alkaliacetigena]|uniref:dihydroorotate dehydrogenase electron transfer subunit n=1 Tax=Fuchsiella alkaliacetigena TaxID=957042 RepID=UPI00200B9673|nr:dihydroorotate dehydrogenase electron transfer subunit [Fuchsiella alkaliacetigena]MCK8825320.1 dihydroorotate dehydrogenase electron transfer subunit [Fuchsiella alkaliacetigena]